MSPRLLIVLVVGYVTLDFANPLMPGAVRFDQGAIHSVHADRPARPAPPGVAEARAEVPGATAVRPEAAPLRPTPPVPARATPPVRRSPPSPPDSSPSMSEDH
jgi:hypothetical protein